MSAAAGARWRTILSGVAILFVFQGHVMLLLILNRTLGRESSLPVLVDWAVLGVILLVAAVPPLGLLRRPSPDQLREVA